MGYKKKSISSFEAPPPRKYSAALVVYAIQFSLFSSDNLFSKYKFSN